MTAPPTQTDDWPQALALLDEALALSPAQREPWLARTAARQPGAMPLLRKLLSAHGRVESRDILATLPRLQRDGRAAQAGAAGLQVGPFELIEPIGRGGMGSVWRARYASGQLKRDVAVKLPAASDDPSALATLRQRFARERDFLAQLEHPNIARLYDAGVSDSGQPFLAMEFVAGRSIAEHCDAQRLGVRARLELFLQVLDAVAYAHQRLVLHRDLKAANVLVDAQGQVRLLDFGVARLLPEVDGAESAKAGDPTELTERVGAAYTLGHAAPEQLTRGPLSTATDVYALGVMLHHLLTGLSPYRPARDSRGALEDAVLLVPPEPASSRLYTAEALAARHTDAAGLRKALRGDLDTIVAKALKKDPAERYPTATALAQDLRLHLARLPIAARPDGWAYRARLFIARHSAGVAATSLATLALIGSSGAAIWQARASAEHAAQAQKEAARAGAAQKFFAGLLADADPEKNKDITALDRRLVDDALASAERDFADAPETLALVLKQLGEIYLRLGIPARVLEVFEKRVALYASLPATPVDEIVEAKIGLGSALSESESAADRARAAPTLIDALDLARTRGASDSVLIGALCEVSDQYLLESKYDIAEKYAAEAVAQAERSLPNPHPKLAAAYEQNAMSNARLGHFDAAREGYRKAMAVDATGRGRGPLEQSMTRANLANMEYVAGNYRAAQREALAAIDFSQAHFGDTGANLAPLRLRAVISSIDAGDLNEAAHWFDKLLSQDLASGDIRRTGPAYYAQGMVAMSRGDLSAAAQAFALAKPGLDIDPRWHRRLLAETAALKLRMGRADDAGRSLAPLLAEMRAEAATGSDEFALVARVAAVAAARQGHTEAAQSLVAEACLSIRARFAPDHPNRIRCDAYETMLSKRLGREERVRALQQLWEKLTAGRDDRMALARSLHLAKSWASQYDGLADRPHSFPLLD